MENVPRFEDHGHFESLGREPGMPWGSGMDSYLSGRIKNFLSEECQDRLVGATLFQSGTAPLPVSGLLCPAFWLYSRSATTTYPAFACPWTAPSEGQPCPLLFHFSFLHLQPSHTNVVAQWFGEITGYSFT